MRTITLPLTGALLAALSLAACEEGGNRIVEIEATGSLRSIAYIDRNGDGKLSPGVDLPAPSLRIAALRGGNDTVAATRTDAAGVAVFASLPVGTYRLAIESAELGDTVQVMSADSATVRVMPTDTAVTSVALGYPTLTTRAARSVSAGRSVAVQGVALHDLSAFGDLMLHVADSTGALRVVSLSSQTTVEAGDVVRVVGRTSVYGGRPALAEASLYRQGAVEVPAPRSISTAAAANAGGGELDGAIIRIVDSELLDIATIGGGDIRLRITDGSGVADVVLDRDVPFRTEAPLIPGIRLSVTGILVPKTGGDGWHLKPRQNLDLQLTIPEATVDQARRMGPGRVVAIEGVALNAWRTFGDATVHVADPTGSIRALRVNPVFLTEGDRVRLIGVTGSFDGQPILSEAAPTVLGRSQVPPPILLQTSAASEANGGAADAALVRVEDAAVTAVLSAGGDNMLRVNDGSGDLLVFLDADAGIGVAAYPVGTRINVTGVLVPAPGGGTWRLKPRSPADVEKR